VLDMLRKATADGNVDVLREGVRVLAEAIMEAEVSELTGVPKGERAPDRRLTNRNGYRGRRPHARMGGVPWLPARRARVPHLPDDGHRAPQSMEREAPGPRTWQIERRRSGDRAQVFAPVRPDLGSPDRIE
jgi:hypothetical protein